MGQKVAIIGAGGIGFDTAEYLSHSRDAAHGRDAFLREWGVDAELAARGGLCADGGQPPASPREIYLLQRKSSKPGDGLGKTTGWIHRTALKTARCACWPG